jgi:hypothetical protein
MARVADYAIVTDSWVLEMDKHSLNFEVPSNIDGGSRSVLGFMLQVGHLDDMKLTLKLNDKEIWNWNYEGSDTNTLQYFQEVVDAGRVKGGKNVFSFHSTSEDATFVQLSDIVLWFQANI